MTSENNTSMIKSSCCKIKKCICDAINKTKETYFECDFDIGEKIHSGDTQNPEINMYKNGNIKVRLFDVLLVASAISIVMSISKIFKK